MTKRASAYSNHPHVIRSREEPQTKREVVSIADFRARFPGAFAPDYAATVTLVYDGDRLVNIVFPDAPTMPITPGLTGGTPK